MPERAICKNKGNCAKISQKMMATYFGKEGIETKCSEFIIPGKKKKYPKNGPNKNTIIMERRELNQNVRIHNSREEEKISQKWAKQKYHHNGKEGIEPTKLGMERRE